MTTEEIVLNEIRDHIRSMDDENRIRVETIAATFRNAVKADPGHAELALSLVGAELAAS